MKTDETLEREVLGLCMCNIDVLPDCLSLGINKSSFSHENLGYIFDVMNRLFLQNKDHSDISVIMIVGENLKNLVRDIAETSARYPNYSILLNALKIRSWSRNVKSGLQSLNEKIICNDTENGKRSTEEAILSFSDGCFDANNGVKITNMGKLLTSSLEHIEEKVQKFKDGIPMGISSGFSKLDQNIFGWQPGMLYVIGARPGVGKTTIGINFANEALKSKNHVLMFSYEMSSNSILEKMYSSRGVIDGNSINTGNMNAGQRQQLEKVIKQMSAEKLEICDSAKTTLSEIKIACRLRKMRGELDLVVIDYITKIHHNSDAKDFQRKIADISSELKEMAMELGIPVIVLAQLKREFDQGKPREPILSDLKESGAIEQDADAVMFVHRPNMNNSAKDQKESYLILRKNRFGKTGIIPMYATMELSKFSQVD